MRKVLITGAQGFAGGYLAEHLRSQGHEVWGTTSRAEATDERTYQLDIRDAAQTAEVVRGLEPHDIYHLAGITRPALGLVSEYYDVNLYGTLNILEAAKTVSARVLVVSSAYVYGAHDTPIDEDTPLRPVNHYGSSKAAADLAAISYALNGLHVVRVRPFNHVGPGQSPNFVLPTLVRQLAEIEAGTQEPVFKLGNVDSVRDFCDVRDMVRAYPLLLDRGDVGAVYNLASGQGIAVRTLAEKVMALSDAEVRLDIDPARQRTTDIPYLVGDPSRAEAASGWHRETALTTTLQDMIAWEQARLRARS